MVLCNIIAYFITCYANKPIVCLEIQHLPPLVSDCTFSLTMRIIFITPPKTCATSEYLWMNSKVFFILSHFEGLDTKHRCEKQNIRILETLSSRKFTVYSLLEWMVYTCITATSFNSIQDLLGLKINNCCINHNFTK